MLALIPGEQRQAVLIDGEPLEDVDVMLWRLSDPDAIYSPTYLGGAEIACNPLNSDAAYIGTARAKSAPLVWECETSRRCSRIYFCPYRLARGAGELEAS